MCQKIIICISKKVDFTLSIISLLFLLQACSCTQIDKTDAQVQNIFLKGPYVQQLRQTAITIVWESDSIYPGIVHYGIGNELTLSARSDQLTEVKKVTLTDLEPESEYFYQVEVNGIKSETKQFRTAVKDESSFSFASYGDNKNGPFNHKKLSDLILSYHPLFVSNNGDLVDRGNVYKQWEKLFFTPTKEMISSIPLIPAIGNHEDNSKYYYNYFCLPDNKAWHSFDLNGAHFVVINTEDEFLEEDGEQITWLVNDLKNNDSEWTFVFQHVPLFTSGGNYYSIDRIKLKNLLHPIFEKYRVDMVIAGHDHHYERSKPITSAGGEHGVTYIVGGNGGTPMRYIGRPKEFSFRSARTFGFSLIEIDGSRLIFKEISIDNEIIDQFEIDKSDSGSLAAYIEKKINFEDIHDPIEASRLYGKGKNEFKNDNYQEALNYLLNAYEVDSNCEEATAMLAEVYFEMNDYENARKFADITMEIAPLHPDSYSVIAAIYEKNGQYDEAVNWYKKQLSVEPDTPDALEDIASIYEKINDLQLFELTLLKAVNLLPNEADLHFRLASFYEENNRIKEALAQYKLGIEWFYDEEQSQEYLHAIEKVKILIP